MMQCHTGKPRLFDQLAASMRTMETEAVVNAVAPVTSAKARHLTSPQRTSPRRAPMPSPTHRATAPHHGAGTPLSPSAASRLSWAQAPLGAMATSGATETPLELYASEASNPGLVS